MEESDILISLFYKEIGDEKESRISLLLQRACVWCKQVERIDLKMALELHTECLWI